MPEEMTINGEPWIPKRLAVEVAKAERGQGYTVRPMRELDPLITPDFAAGILHCSGSYMRRLCQERVIKAVKVGSRWMVNSQSLLEYAGLEG